MMFRGSKKGNLAVAIVVVIALFIVMSQVVDIATRECSLDKDCNSDSYCGSDFQCHKYPTIYESNYIPAAFLLGICIVGAAIILRWKQ
jgi:hypothetical protein